MTEPLTCPGCREPMKRENFVSAFVDDCTGCHGLWFDAGELAKLDHKTKGFGAALERAVARTDSGTPREQEEIECPRCQQPLEAVQYELERSVVIDECPGCAGVFLDAGELRMIRLRDRTATEEARVHRRRRSRRARAQRKDEEYRRIQLHAMSRGVRPR